jgi:hypothetical protein
LFFGELGTNRIFEAENEEIKVFSVSEEVPMALLHLVLLGLSA